MTETFKPLHDYVLLRRSPTSQKQGLIHVPGTVVDYVPGEVIATGDGHWERGTFVSSAVEAGDRVLFRPLSAEPIDYRGSRHFLLRESDIVAILGEED